MNAVVTRRPDKTAEAWAKRYGYHHVVQDGWELPEERTLFVADGAAIPYRLLEAGFGFLEKWEVAAPLWRYGVLAKDAGTPSDRARTETVALDLRVLLYGHELLFVRRGSDGERFLETWRRECDGGDERLAFLRALHLVKPLLCALPCAWLSGDAQRGAVGRRDKVFTMVGGALTEVRPTKDRAPQLVQVQIAPGRYVQCKPGEEEATFAKFATIGRRRSHGVHR